MKPTKQPARPAATSVVGGKPYQDQVSYINEVKAHGSATDTQLIRDVFDHFIHSTPATDFWSKVNAWKTKPDEVVNPSQAVVLEVNAVRDDTALAETFAGATVNLRDTSAPHSEQSVVVVYGEAGRPQRAVNRTVVGIVAVGALLALCSLTFFAGRITAPAKAELNSLRETTARLRDELIVAHDDVAQAKAQVKATDERAKAMEVVMLRSWAGLHAETVSELHAKVLANQRVAAARLAQMAVNVAGSSAP